MSNEKNTSFFSSLFSDANNPNSKVRTGERGGELLENWQLGNTTIQVATNTQEDGAFRTFMLPGGIKIETQTSQMFKGGNSDVITISGQNHYPTYSMRCENGTCSYTVQNSFEEKAKPIPRELFNNQASVIGAYDPKSMEMIRQAGNSPSPQTLTPQKTLAVNAHTLDAWHIEIQNGGQIKIDHASPALPQGHDIKTYAGKAKQQCNAPRAFGNTTHELDSVLKDAIPDDVLIQIKQSVQQGARFDIQTPCNKSGSKTGLAI